MKASPSPKIDSLCGYILLSMVVIASLFSIWETTTRRAKVPSRETWDEAVAQIKPLLKKGDLVTWYPEWAGEARLSLHGMPIILLPHHGEVDLGAAQRLWVLGAFGYDGEGLAKGDHLKTLQKLKRVSTEQLKKDDSGAVSISLLQVIGEKMEHDLYEELSEPNKIQVFRSPILHLENKEICDFWALNGWHCTSASQSLRQKIERCLQRPQSEQLKQRSKQRTLYTLDQRRSLPYIDCHLNPTEHISRDWRMIGDSPRRCISMRPHHRREVELRWYLPQSEMDRSLWLSFGWEDLAVRHPFRASQATPIVLKVKRGTQSLFDQTLDPKLGWNREVFILSADRSAGPPVPLSVIYHAPEGVKDAQFCISLDVRAQPTL